VVVSDFPRKKLLNYPFTGYFFRHENQIFHSATSFGEVEPNFWQVIFDFQLLAGRLSGLQ
jgi:hypothetical protein